VGSTGGLQVAGVMLEAIKLAIDLHTRFKWYTPRVWYIGM
jgi:hypothetical protein